MKKLIKKNKEDFIIIVISLIAIVVGSFAIGIVNSLTIVLIIDIFLLLIPKLLKKKKNRQKKNKGNALNIILTIVFSCGIIVLSGAIAFFGYIIINAPTFDPERMYNKEATVIYDKDLNEIAKLGSQKREKITFDDLSESLIDAIIATEDSRYFQHNGFDLPRFLRASVGQLSGRDAGGASTITMQVVKNQYTGTEATGIKGIIRKFTDIYMSIFKLEKKYTKEEIVEFYVNSYYLGNDAYGVEQASFNYFGKSAKDLNIAEAALIAGLFNAPVAYDPYNNIDLAEERRQIVLYLMQRHGYITEEERDIAISMSIEKLLVKSNTTNQKYKGFIDTVIEEVILKTKNNPYTVPMMIYTTMDSSKQEVIDEFMNGNTDNYKWENDVVQAGIAVTSVEDGSIVAIGAGRNRKGERTFNYATMLKNHIGSTAKPLYDYGPAIEYNNYTPYTQIVDEPHGYSSGGSILNWDFKYKGQMSIREALVDSRNIPALKTFQNVSNKKIKEFVTNLGLHPEIQGNVIYEPHSLGGYNGESPLSIAAAYRAFAAGGYYIEPYSFTKIVYRDTDQVYEHKFQMKRVMSQETAYFITDMLISTGKTYPLSNLRKYQFGAKSGTSNLTQDTIKELGLSSRAVSDLWVVGITNKFAIAEWYGYEKLTSEYHNRFGSGQNQRLFNAIAPKLFEGSTTFERPDTIIEVEVEKETITPMLPSEYTPSNLRTTELFISGTEPAEVSPRFSQLDNVTNLTYEAKKNNITLEWNGIKTPDALNENYIRETLRPIYYNDSNLDSAVTARIDYNIANIGSVAYDVYQKVGETLTLLGTTTDTKYTFKATQYGDTTYIVKTCYTIFKDNMSSGTSIEIKVDEVESLITSELNTNRQNTITLKVGETFAEKNPPVLVYENGILITSNDIIITKTGTYDNSKPGVYDINYNVSYKTHQNNLKLTIIVTN